MIFTPSPVSAQEVSPETTAVPTPYPNPTWPEVITQPNYTPAFDPAEEPAALQFDAPVVAANTEAVAADTEANKSGVVVGAASATLTPEGGQVQLGNLQISLSNTAGALAQPVMVQAEVLPVEQANALSPVGMAFKLATTSPLSVSASAADQLLQLTLDYSQIPLRYGGDFAGRLTLYRVSGCEEQIFAAEQVVLEGSKTQAPNKALHCKQWEPLSGANNRVAQTLTVSLSSLSSNLTSAEASGDSASTAQESNLPVRLYLPVMATQNQSSAVQDTEALYVLASAANSPQGDYRATPLSAVRDYHVSLFTGALATSYPIPLPPAMAGVAPNVNLAYNSESINGMAASRNNQPGPIGIGWEAENNAIVWHLKYCEPVVSNMAVDGYCTTGDNYSITLNGVSSTLVKESNNLYRLQNDPRWKVEKLTSTAAGHPDADKVYWRVTTPDGTKYRFGGEIEPESNADQNSVVYMAIRDLNYNDKAWRWNLDRVEDVNGNLVSYFYDAESNLFTVNSTELRWYTRAANLSRIEYTKRVGQTITPNARVMFNQELRCTDPTVGTSCDDYTDFPDTPVDLNCRGSGFGDYSCTHRIPSFWSQYRLDNIQTQVYDQTNNRWKTVAIYDLGQSFPPPPNVSYGKKLWLNTITQRPGGNFNLYAFQQIEAERYDSRSGVTVSPATGGYYDFGASSYVQSGGNGTYIVHQGVNFDGGANQMLVRFAHVSSGVQMEFRLDSVTGTKIGEINMTAGSTSNIWKSALIALTGATGTHDLYIVFKQTYASLNWFRFKSTSSLSGLPPVTYGYQMLANRRTWTSSVEPMDLPRINKITTELGGVVDFVYGKSHLCPLDSTLPSTIRMPYDCFPVYDPGNSAYPDTGLDSDFALWNRWKVLQMKKSDTFSGNPTEVYTYTYSAPIHAYSDDPTLRDINYTTCYPVATSCNKRHWNDFRGHASVTVTDGSGAKTEYRFHQGMNGDRLNFTGGTYTANITLSDNTTRTDHKWLRGETVEVRNLKANGTAVVRTAHLITGTLTAGTVITGSYFIGTPQTDQFVYGTVNKSTRVERSYDSYGNVIREIQHGDTSTTSDDRNLERSFVYNPSAYIMDKPQWEKLWSGVGSGATGQEKSFTAYLYDGATTIGTAPVKGNLTRLRSYWQATPTYESVETTTIYDSYGRPTTITDARGNTTTTAYHSFYGYVTSVTNDLNHVTTMVNDPGWGAPTQITDANNNITNVQYDNYGRLTKVWLPTEPTSGVASLEFVYDAAARPANVKSRTLQVKASSTYQEGWQYVDGFGRELQSQTPAVTSGQRIVSSKKYNNLGQLRQASASYQISGNAGSGYSAPNWATMLNYQQYSYEELGRLWLDETMNNSTVLWSNTTIYDGWQKRVYSPNGKRTDYDQNAFGQLVKVTEYNVGSVSYNTTYSYDLQGSLTGVTDHLSNVTTINYDLVGCKTSMIDPDMGSWQYQYDAVGNLTGQRDARNQWLYMEYDDLNRLVKKRRDVASTGPLIAEYLYDAVGQKGLLSSSKAYSSAGTTVEAEVQSVTYDSRNRLTQQRWVVNGAGSFRMDTTFNEANQKTSLTYPGGTSGQAGEVVSYQYNAVGQLTGVSGLLGIQYISSATYNAQGQLTQLVNDTSPNGLTRKWTYETNTLRLSTLQAGNNATFDNLQKLTYSYDNSGNVTSLVDTVNSNQKQCFQYDWLNRLTGAFTGDAACAAYSATGTGPFNHTYTYNEVGNITNYAGNAYTYGDTTHKHAVTAAFGNTYGYDANGNQTTRTIGGVTYTFTYDYENRITAISGGSTTASFVYDASGQRVKGTVNGVTTVYVAGVYEYQNGATTHYYEGNAIRRTGYATDNGVFYLLQDHLKSSSALANQNGTLNGNRNYFFPFGGNRGGTSFNGVTNKRFTGQYHEKDLPGGEGLSYYGARWYDAKLGRFLSADTIVPGPGNPQAFNRYSYVLNRPTGLVDPSGHAPCSASGGVKFCDNAGIKGGGSKVYIPTFGTISSSANKAAPSLSQYPSAAFPRKPAPGPSSTALFFKNVVMPMYPDVWFSGYSLQGGLLANVGGGSTNYWDVQNLQLIHAQKVPYGGASPGWGFAFQSTMGAGYYRSSKVDPKAALSGKADEWGVDVSTPEPGFGIGVSAIYGNNTRFTNANNQVFMYGTYGGGASIGSTLSWNNLSGHYSQPNIPADSLTVVRSFDSGHEMAQAYLADHVSLTYSAGKASISPMTVPHMIIAMFMELRSLDQ